MPPPATLAITLSNGYIKLSRRRYLRPGLLVRVTRKGDPGTRTGCGLFICENVRQGGTLIQGVLTGRCPGASEGLLRTHGAVP